MTKPKRYKRFSSEFKREAKTALVVEAVRGKTTVERPDTLGNSHVFQSVAEPDCVINSGFALWFPKEWQETQSTTCKV